MIFALFVSFVISFAMIPTIICVAQSLRIHDVPDERKIHTTPKPSLGGMGIFAGIVLTVLMAVPFPSAPEFQYFIAAALVLFFVGLKDDLDGLSPFRKFIGQTLATALAVHKGGIHLNNMYGFLGIYQLSDLQGLLLTYFAVIVIINSINLIDGVDGLAGSFGLMVALVLGVYFFDAGLHNYSFFAFALAGSLAAFLIYNFHPSRIFMGDTGSLLVGLSCAILVIKFIRFAAENAEETISASPAIGFTLLMVPLLDCLRVFATRILNGRSPFSPDKNHIHHLLLAAGLSHKGVTIVLVLINLICLLFSYTVRSIGNTWLIVFITTVFFASEGILKYRLRRQRPVPETAENKKASRLKTPVKIIPISNNLPLADNELVKNR